MVYCGQSKNIVEENVPHLHLVRRHPEVRLDSEELRCEYVFSQNIQYSLLPRRHLQNVAVMCIVTYALLKLSILVTAI